MLKRKSNLFFICIAFLLSLLGLLFAHAHFQKTKHLPLLAKKQEMVKRLELTDLCLFTDARYTRHLSMADLNSPFQDYPVSFDYFPSGSIFAPPPHLRIGGK